MVLMNGAMLDFVMVLHVFLSGWSLSGGGTWKEGQTLFFSALLWFKEEELLAKIPWADINEHNVRDIYVEGYVLRRSAKLVTLRIPAIGSDFRRGFTFMSVSGSVFLLLCVMWLNVSCY